MKKKAPDDVFRVYHVTLRRKHRKNASPVKMEFCGPGCDKRAVSFRVAMFRPDLKVIACEDVSEQVALCEECFNPEAPAEPHRATRILVTVDQYGRFGGMRLCDHHEGPSDMSSLVQIVATGEATYAAMAQRQRKVQEELENDAARRMWSGAGSRGAL